MTKINVIINVMSSAILFIILTFIVYQKKTQHHLYWSSLRNNWTAAIHGCNGVGEGCTKTGPGLLLSVVRFLQTKFLDTCDDGLKDKWF